MDIPRLSLIYSVCLFAHQAQFKSIYTIPRFKNLILKTSQEMQLDLTECLTDVAKGKLVKCIATRIFDEGCDFYFYKKCTSVTFEKRWCKNNPKMLPSHSNLKKVRFSRRRKLVVIVHGVSENYTSLWLQTAKNHLLDNHNVNVVMMDWRSKVGYSMVAVCNIETHLGLIGTSSRPRSNTEQNYIKVQEPLVIRELLKFQHIMVILADVFGRRLAGLLENLISTGVSCPNIHLVGVGMGAQIVAFAGKYLKAQNKTIGRITGLNPSGDIFESQPRQFRLDKMDAAFVDCIFTDYSEMAMRDLVCGANFYPNCYGEKQLGENNIARQDRATILFAESVMLGHTFHAKKCAKNPCQGTGPKNCEINRTALMGYPASQKLNGIFYVKTRGHYPFSTAIEEPKLRRRLLFDWIKRITGSKKRDRREKPKRGSILANEVALLRQLLAYGLESGLTLTKCTAKTLSGFKAAIQCIISNFMVVNCDFYIYTEEKRGTPIMLETNNLKRQTEELNIDKNKKIVFIIHGVTVSYKLPWIQQTKDDLLANYDVNVILMDWRSKVDHILMASNIGLIPLAKSFGQRAAQFLTGLLKAGWKISRFHLVGHSLGGQIVGFVGKSLKHVKRTLPRITALDPAGLLFDIQSTRYRLDKNDAKFVDCVFTSSPIIGMRYPVCTANFYANCYGKDQPGTKTDKIGGSTTLSHQRAALLFGESVIPSHEFHAKKCEKLPCHGTDPEDCVELNGTVLMGYPASSKLEGIFYVKTRGTYPFSLKISRKSNESDEEG